MNVAKRRYAAFLLVILLALLGGWWLVLRTPVKDPVGQSLQKAEVASGTPSEIAKVPAGALKTAQEPAKKDIEVPKPPEPRWQPPRFIEGYILPIEMFASGRHVGLLVNDYTGNRDRALALLLSSNRGESWQMFPAPVAGSSNFCSAGAVLDDGSAAVLMGAYAENNNRKHYYDLYIRRKDAYEPAVRIWDFEGSRGAFRPEVLGVGNEFWAFAQGMGPTGPEGKIESRLDVARVQQDGQIERLPALKGMAHKQPVACALDANRLGACVWRETEKDLAWGTIAWGAKEWEVHSIAKYVKGEREYLSPLRAVRQGNKLAVAYSGQETGPGGYTYWVAVSTDDGKTWQSQRVVKGHTGEMLKLAIGWQGERLYAFYMEDFGGVPLTSVFSDDLGKTWTKSNDFVIGSKMQGILAAHTPDTLYVAFNQLGQRGTTITGWLGIKPFSATAWDEPKKYPEWYKPSALANGRKEPPPSEDF